MQVVRAEFPSVFAHCDGKHVSRKGSFARHLGFFGHVLTSAEYGPTYLCRQLSTNQRFIPCDSRTSLVMRNH